MGKRATLKRTPKSQDKPSRVSSTLVLALESMLQVLIAMREVKIAREAEVTIHEIAAGFQLNLCAWLFTLLYLYPLSPGEFMEFLGCHEISSQFILVFLRKCHGDRERTFGCWILQQEAWLFGFGNSRQPEVKVELYPGAGPVTVEATREISVDQMGNHWMPSGLQENQIKPIEVEFNKERPLSSDALMPRKRMVLKLELQGDVEEELEETEGVNGQPRPSRAKGLAWLWKAKCKLSHWSRLYTDEKENAQSDK
ncbi:hypothetical protein TURU_033223 [Turdus rufiventris]|nr:hypothetical protein TURU_033223 [Turdus rufiventris]